MHPASSFPFLPAPQSLQGPFCRPARGVQNPLDKLNPCSNMGSTAPKPSLFTIWLSQGSRHFVGGLCIEGVCFMSAQPRRLRLEVEDIGDVTVVNFVDRKILDEQNIQIIGEQLFSLVDEVGRRKLLLNFGNVEYLSSAALGKLITLNKKLQAAGGRLILCNIDPQIYEVFEITKLDRFFNIQKDEQGGLQAF